MAIESPRPLPKLGGYQEADGTPSTRSFETTSVKLRLRAPFVEDAPEAEAERQLDYSFSFEPEVALKRAQERLDEARTTGVQNDVAVSWDEAARLHLAACKELRTGHALEALEMAQRAQALCGSLREAPREALARGLQVEAHIALGDHAQALAIASEHLEDLRQRQDHFSYSEGLRQRSVALLASEDLEESVTSARASFNAASRLRGQKRVLTQASALEQLVEASRRSGNFEAMTQAAEELAACCREILPKLPSKEARALRLCTRGQLMLRRPKRAIQSAGRAMTLFKEQGDHQAADEMRLLFVRAQSLREGMQEAARDAQQAWLLYREHGDPRLLFQAAKNCHDAHHKFDDQNVLLLEKL